MERFCTSMEINRPVSMSHRVALRITFHLVLILMSLSIFGPAVAAQTSDQPATKPPIPSRRIDAERAGDPTEGQPPAVAEGVKVSAKLVQNQKGVIRFDRIEWQAGLPLRMLEDARLDVPLAGRVAWLSEWHTDLEWLRALHKTQYSNGFIGLHEQFIQFPTPGTDVNAAGLSADDRLLHRFRRRQRALVETDMLIVANNHWNFDVRGLIPAATTDLSFASRRIRL
jgi:hypothetical protein